MGSIGTEGPDRNLIADVSFRASYSSTLGDSRYSRVPFGHSSVVLTRCRDSRRWKCRICERAMIFSSSFLQFSMLRLPESFGTKYFNSS